MKKYLIKGALALFSGGLLFSCAEKESEYVPLAQQKSKAFEDVFQEIYGDVDPYQDWGFSSGKVVIDPNDSTQVVEVVDLDANISVTRTKAFSRSGARTRGKWTTEPYCDTDGKFWVDNYGYYPPAKITPEEWAAVYEEFSKVHEDRGESVRFTDYFVQQVHSSKDNPLNVYPYFPDQTGASSTVNAWDHMDQLVCGLKNTHGNNFNGCADPGLIDIWDGVSYGGGDGKQKVVDTDSVQLLLNCDTKRFGYYNSLDSKYHYEYIILEVNGAYYVGFDFCASYSFKTMNDDGTFVKSNYEQDPGESRDPNFNGYQPISNTEIKYNDDGTIKGYEGGDKDVHRDHIYNDWIIKITPALIVEPEPEIDYEYPVYEDVEWEQVERGRVFCEDLGQATREDLDYNDVVFDAIIFKKVSTERMWQVRFVDGEKADSVECQSEPGGTKTYPQVSTNYYANVELLAAGGTIPVTIQGNLEDSETYQVHDQFDPTADIATMVNTRDNNSTAYGSFEERDPVQLGDIEKNFQATLPNGDTEDFNVKLFEIDYPDDFQAIKQIKIVSRFGEAQQAQELKSERGEKPRKFMAPYGTKWTSERKNISLAYPLFGQWVKNEVTRDVCFSSDNTNPDYLYSGAYKSNGLKLPLVMKARRSYVAGIEHDIWSGDKEYGNSWNLENLDTKPVTKDFDKFYPGDRLRFYGTKIKDDAWITVVIGDIKPYFVDSEFPNYTLDPQGNKIPLELDKTSCIEVMLDEYSANLLNSEIRDGKLTFQVQGRNFTLTRICRVLFN